MTARRRFGYVRKLPSGRWQASYLGPDGVRRSAPQTFGSRTDAGRWLTLVESEIMRGTWTSGEIRRTTVDGWAERWLSAHERHLKRTTAATYRTALRTAVVPTFGGVALGNVRPIDVGEWLAGLTKAGKSAGWVRQCYRLLALIMRAAVDNDLIPVSPCRGHRLPRTTDPEPMILDEHEVAALIDAAKPSHGVMLAVLAYGGLRIGEVFALRVRDVEDGGRLVTIARRKAEIAGRVDFDLPKSHQVRAVQLPEFVAVRLRAHMAEREDRAPDALLFVGARGGVLRYNSWRRSAFDPAVAAAGLTGLTPHDLRATHATWVADRHGVLVAARRLGHSNASVTTRHYARAVKGRDAEVAASFDVQHDRQDSALIARGSHGTGADGV